MTRISYRVLALPLVILPLLPGYLALRDLQAGQAAMQADRLEDTLDFREALEQRRRAVQLTPTDPQRHLELADAAASLWQLRGSAADKLLADREYARADTLDPGGTEALVRHAQMYRYHGQPEVALTFLQRALPQDPFSAGLTVELARTQQEAGLTRQAKVSYARCLTLDEVPECRAGQP